MEHTMFCRNFSKRWLSGLLPACLLACTTLAAAAPASAAAGCEPRSLAFGQGGASWKHAPMSKLKRDTAYTLLQEDGRTVLRATADGAASFYLTYLEQPLPTPAMLSWHWKTDALVPGADNRDKQREDAPLRVLVGFGGDPATLSAAEQKRFKKAEKSSGRAPPYAMLWYIWSDKVAVDSVLPFAHSGRVKMIVVAAGASGLGRWQSVRRNLAEDYRRAYGAEPGPLMGVAVMTDTDNTGAQATGYYADIKLECAVK
jgi:hypothetical protein